MHYFLLLFSLLFSGVFFSQDQLNLIPYPQTVEFQKGEFILNNQTAVKGMDPSFEYHFFLNSLRKEYHLDLSKNKRKSGNNGNNVISIEIDETIHQEIEYQIHVDEDLIVVKAKNNEGIFHGLQTLLQLIQTSKNGKIPALKIEDKPKFNWRGMHLNVCRHFFTVEEVKQYIDYLAMYKLNTFHWHVTDDQGWRIEIKKYPKLTQIGSKRKESMIGAYVDDAFDGIPYGPYFYTQEQIKEVVKYAQERHITVVPEIEMPGHALAALSAYPELACTKGPFEPATKWGVFDDVFCPKEETFNWYC